MKYLIFGGNGFIGKHLCQFITNRGDDCLSFDMVKGQDIRNPDQVKDAFNYNPNIVINLAFESIVSKVDDKLDESFATGLVGNKHIIDCCWHHGVYKYVYVSSSMVYGDFLTNPCTEEHPLRPKSWYGIIKAMVENDTRKNSPSYSIVRPTAIYGPDDTNKRVVSLFIDKILKGETITIKSDSKYNFTHVKDCVKGIFLAANHKANDIFNICHSESYQLRELVQTIELVTNKKIDLIYDKDENIPIKGTLSCEKANRILGFIPNISLLKGIEDYVQNSTL